MARFGIVFGIILCGVTFAGLVGTTAKSPTQFYAMMLGIPILFCGVVALNPHRRRLAMQFALGIALVGAVLGGLWSAVQILAYSDSLTDIDRYSLRLIAIMTAICVVFVGICLVGFRQLRRRSSGGFSNPMPTVRLSNASDKITEESDIPTSREIA